MTPSHRDSRSDLSSTAGILLSISPIASSTNESIAEVICNSTAQFSSMEILPFGTTRFLFPECIYFLPNNILSFLTASNVIFSGNSTYPDPLIRLATGMKNAASVIISRSFFVPYGAAEAAYTPNWTQVFAAYPTINLMTIEYCSIAGSLPSILPQNLLRFSLAGNAITGSIPSGMFDNYASLTSTPPAFTWLFSGNKLNGTLPASLLTTLPPQSSFILFLDGNQLSGTIPKTFLNLTHGSTATGITLSLTANLIIDTFPNDLWGLPSDMASLKSMSIYTSANALSGTIPTTWMNEYLFPVMTYLYISAVSCNISGSLNTGVLPGLAPALTSYSLYLNNNPLNAPIDSNLLPTILSNSFSSPSPVIAITCLNCGITGSLALPSPISTSNLPRIFLVLSSSSLTSLNVSVGAWKYISWLDLASNTALQGNVENLFSSSNSVLSNLNLDNTKVSGNMPYMALMNTSRLQVISMEGTNVDFCAGGSARTSWNVSTALSVCNLKNTRASECASKYPLCTVTAPIAAPTPIACPGSQPSVEFECVNGVWTSSGSVTAPTIVISPGTSEVIVNGNVTSGTVVLQGTGSSITVTGCFTNLSVVTIQLTPEDLKKLGSHSEIQLLRSSGNCSDFSTVAVGTTVSGSSCRTVKVDKVATSSGSLNGLLSVSSSGCNVWWIILVSILAVLTIAGVIVLLVILRIRKTRVENRAKAALRG